MFLFQTYCSSASGCDLSRVTIAVEFEFHLILLIIYSLGKIADIALQSFVRHLVAAFKPRNTGSKGNVLSKCVYPEFQIVILEEKIDMM